MHIYRLLFMTLLASLLVILGCNNEDDDPDVNDIIGEWKLVGLEYTGKTVVRRGGIVSDQTTSTGNAYDIISTIKFTENPDEVIFSGTYNILIETTDMNGQTSTEDLKGVDQAKTSSYTREGNKITFTPPRLTEPVDGTIESLTANTAAIRWIQQTTQTRSVISSLQEIDIRYILER